MWLLLRTNAGHIHQIEVQHHAILKLASANRVVDRVFIWNRSVIKKTPSKTYSMESFRKLFMLYSYFSRRLHVHFIWTHEKRECYTTDPLSIPQRRLLHRLIEKSFVNQSRRLHGPGISEIASYINVCLVKGSNKVFLKTTQISIYVSQCWTYPIDIWQMCSCARSISE